VNQAPTKFGGSADGPGAQTQDILSPTLTNTTPVTRYDYQDAIFHTGIGTDNNVSVSGGTDMTKYFVSGSYFFNQGIIKNTDFQRFSFRANIDQRLNKWSSVVMGLNYTNSRANEKPDGNSFFSPMNAVTILGNIHNIWERDALGNLKAVGERGRVNPLSIIEDFQQKQTTGRILSNIGFKLNPITNLSLDYTMGVDNFSQLGTTFIPPFAYNVSDANFGGGATLDPSRNGYASTASNTFFAINHDVNATYNAKLTSDLSSTTQAGFTQQYERNNYVLLQGRGLAPFVQTVNGASTIIAGSDDRSELSVSGAFLQQNFKYKNHFFVTGAVRLDGSSVFGEDQRSQKYVKASGSYVLSSTDFWKGLGTDNWLDLFKVRLAYGESGNLTGIGAYERFNTYTSSSFIGRTALSGRTRLANENVKPERQQELEFGADLVFFKNRASLSFNVYNKKVKDLLIDRQIAPTTGFTSLLDNFGSLENKGFELIINATPVATKNVNWSITAIYNRNRNKATKIGQALTLFNTNAAALAILENYPIGVFYGTFFAMNANGEQVKTPAGIPQIERGVQNSPVTYTPSRDANGLPVTTATVVRKILGDPNPDYTGSLVNEVNYKKLNLRVQLDAVQGVDVWNA
ncbi:MAG TPA: SusC/RagA family TonB-linked outer membrane protein, partial [Segetibacter sp.]